MMLATPVDAGERRPGCWGHLCLLRLRPPPWPIPPDAHPGAPTLLPGARLPLADGDPPPSGGTGLPLDLSGHAAKVLSRRWRWTSGTIPPHPRFTDDRCQLAPGRVAAIALTRPACASLVTSRTPARPRALRSRRKASQPAPSSLVVTWTPRI